MSHDFKMMPRHWAMLSTFITTIVAIAIFVVLWGLKPASEAKKIGEFEFEGAKTAIFQAGECQIYATKWKSHSDHPSEPRFFFSCNK